MIAIDSDFKAITAKKRPAQTTSVLEANCYTDFFHTLLRKKCIIFDLEATRFDITPNSISRQFQYGQHITDIWQYTKHNNKWMKGTGCTTKITSRWLEQAKISMCDQKGDCEQQNHPNKTRKMIRNLCGVTHVAGL